MANSGGAGRNRAPATLMRRALVASVAVHLIGAAPFIVRALLPDRGTSKPAPILAEVELVQQDTPTVGDGSAQASPTQPSSASDPPTPIPLKPDEQEVAAVPRPALPPQPAPQDQQSQQAAAAVPTTSSAPAVRLGEGGDPGTGLVTGDAVIPGGINTAVQNRLPGYPPEAARRGEEGVVVLLVQIAPDGSASAVDVGESSGYELLDRTARAAVARWHFRPAVQDGMPIASTMEVEVHFAIRRKPS